MPEIRFIFHCIELAEDFMLKVGNPKGLFRLLRPSPVLRGKADSVIQAHMEEIHARYTSRQDPRPGTDAECLCAMMQTATMAPLNSTGMALVEHLFERVMGQPFDAETFGRERYPGAMQEELQRVRQKLLVPDRTLES